MFLHYDLNPYTDDQELSTDNTKDTTEEIVEDFDLPLDDTDEEIGSKGGIVEKNDFDWFEDDSDMSSEYNEEEMSANIPDLLTPDYENQEDK